SSYPILILLTTALIAHLLRLLFRLPHRLARVHDTNCAQMGRTPRAGSPFSCPRPSKRQIPQAGHSVEWGDVETMDAGTVQSSGYRRHARAYRASLRSPRPTSHPILT